MRFALWIITSTLTLLSVYSLPDEAPPVFADNYVSEGILVLPIAGIREPFKAYFDKTKDKSRIDYYGGNVKTFQRADLGDSGMNFKVAYVTNATGDPVRTCLQAKGSADNPVKIQGVLPIIPDFKLIAEVPCDEKRSLERDQSTFQICKVWELRVNVEDTMNRYTMYVDKNTGAPHHYILKGFNGLLMSHTDLYEIHYYTYLPGLANDNDFEMPESLKCSRFPGSDAEVKVFSNPMSEFINNEDQHIHESFELFKYKHGKIYSDSKEHEFRKNIFRQNYRYVESKNRAGLSYALKLNHFADFTDQEMHRVRGRVRSHGYNGGKPFNDTQFSDVTLDFLDWRLAGAVTPVKDQAVCVSSWAFGATGTIEGQYFIKTNKRVRLSEQQLIDCSWQHKNYGCDGGKVNQAYDYIQAVGGLASEDDYGNYIGADGICHDKNVPITATIKGYVNITSGDLKALKKAVSAIGPISVMIDASQRDLWFYSHGFYYNPKCKNESSALDHTVLLTGYGNMLKVDDPYWIIKNSWSTYWGNDGYMLIKQRDNNCGVATAATYVEM